MREKLIVKIDATLIFNFLIRRGLSKAWLADQLNCSPRTVDNILAGRTPNVKTTCFLAHIMGVSVEDLLMKENKARSA